MRTGPATPPGLSRKSRPRRIIAVGGGKGGIGKTLVSANLGIALAQAGQRVLLVDADLGGANLHTALGMTQPTLTLSDFVHRQRARLEDVIVPSGYPNLSLIAGAQDVLDAANLKYPQKQKLLRNLQGQSADYLLLDLGAGTHFNTLDLFLLADMGILVLLPEPTSVENAYRFAKAAFFRRLQNLSEELGLEELMEEAVSSREGALRTPHEFVSEIRRRDAVLGERLERELSRFRIQVVINQTRTTADQGMGAAVVSAWKKFFGLELETLGSIVYDDEAWRSVRKRRPVLIEGPQSQASASLRLIAERILQLDGRIATPRP